MSFAGLTPSDAPTLASIARALGPRVRERPSEWVRRNVTVVDEGGGFGAGLFDIHHLPWTRAALDALIGEPLKRGVVMRGPAQVGKTIGMFGTVGSRIATDPCNVLYMVENEDKASELAMRRWRKFVLNTRVLRELIAAAADDGERTTQVDWPFPGGALNFRWAGSASGATGTPYPLVVLDDYTLILKSWDRSLGSPWNYALGRTNACRAISQVWTFAHPTVEGEGIDELFRQLSDARHWSFSCPHCGSVILPSWWTCVDLRGLDREARPDPERAVFVCPACAREVAAGERAREVWPEDRGGSGRFESELAPEDAAGRQYTGLALHGLVHPRFALADLVREYLSLRSDQARLGWMGPRLGEPFRSGRIPLTADGVRARLADRPTRVMLPGGERGVRYACAGVDVQDNAENPVLYVQVEAYAASGAEYLAAVVKLRGWPALGLFLAEWNAPVANESGVIAGTMGISLCTIDCRFGTSHVLEFARYTRVNSIAGGRRVKVLPVEFEPSLDRHRGEPWYRMSSDAQRTDPDNPAAGKVDRYQLHRHTVVEEGLSRWGGGERMRVLCEVPPEYEAHLRSQQLLPVKSKHGWDDGREEWVKIHNRIDDWLMAGCYCRAGAVIELGLNRIHALPEREAKRREVAAGRGDRRRDDWWRGVPVDIWR